jgi:hypothetical protein
MQGLTEYMATGTAVPMCTIQDTLYKQCEGTVLCGGTVCSTLRIEWGSLLKCATELRTSGIDMY